MIMSWRKEYIMPFSQSILDDIFIGGASYTSISWCKLQTPVKNVFKNIKITPFFILSAMSWIFRQFLNPPGWNCRGKNVVIYTKCITECAVTRKPI